jgi:hypothetical protein
MTIVVNLEGVTSAQAARPVTHVRPGDHFLHDYYFPKARIPPGAVPGG